MNNSGSFNRLVSDLSPVERRELLEKMKGVPVDSAGEELTPAEAPAETPVPFSVQIQNESIFTRLWLWLRALFANSTMEALYNESRLTQLARNVERIAPGMIDIKRGFLLEPLYEALTEMKAGAVFFRPYVAALEENVGDFYILLGSIIMPDVESVIDTEIDPYSQPLTAGGGRSDLRVQLVRRLDTVMQELSADAKAQMYLAARAANWLQQFARLPFARILSHFNTVAADAKRCTFTPVESDLGLCAKVLSETIQVPDEVLEALYLFSGRVTTDAVADGETSEERSAEQFMARSRSVVRAIRRFMHTVPLRSLTRLVKNNAQWYPENFTGGEDWFIQYKSSMKRLFDRKWEAWTLDCRKEALRGNLKKNFQLDEFPLLPDRPWTRLWGGMPFRYELTAGFLNYYFRDCFPSYELTLKTLMLEGIFIQKPNRVEYTEAFNDLIQVSIDLNSLNNRLKGSGDIGVMFQRLLNDRTRTLQGQSKAEDMIKSAENDVGNIIYKFGESCRRIDLVLNGLLHVDKEDPRYASISNFADIQGKNNSVFLKRLAEAKLSLKDAYSLLLELEPLDSPAATLH